MKWYRVTHISAYTLQYTLCRIKKQFWGVFIELRIVAYLFFKHLEQSKQVILI